MAEASVPKEGSMTEQTRFTDLEKFVCVERELKMRRQVYPRWVQIGKMTQSQADRELDLMAAIAADYAPPRLI